MPSPLPCECMILNSHATSCESYTRRLNGTKNAGVFSISASVLFKLVSHIEIDRFGSINDKLTFQINCETFECKCLNRFLYPEPYLGSINDDRGALAILKNGSSLDPVNSPGHVYKFVCISFRTDNLNCFRVS